MKIKILFLSLLFLFPISNASAAWYTGVVEGIDVWTVDLSASNYDTAVSACASLESGAFLPTLDQLELMYIDEASLGTFGDVDYWSVSTFDNTNAYRLDFFDGSTDYGLKSSIEDVRCVRSTPYDYDEAEVLAMNTELGDMLTQYFPPILLIFGLIFALGLFRKLVRTWLNR